jgi:hypothetical protein
MLNFMRFLAEPAATSAENALGLAGISALRCRKQGRHAWGSPNGEAIGGRRTAAASVRS